MYWAAVLCSPACVRAVLIAVRLYLQVTFDSWHQMDAARVRADALASRRAALTQRKATRLQAARDRTLKSSLRKLAAFWWRRKAAVRAATLYTG